MTPSPIPTPTERDVLNERIVIARCICKTGKYPTDREIAGERSKLNWASSTSTGEKVSADPTEADAQAFLVSLGLTPPPRAPKSDTDTAQ